jgi:hypothetical protein
LHDGLLAVAVHQAAKPDSAGGGVSRKIPATIPVASTEWVSRNTQNVTANHIVKLMTDTSSVLTNRCTNVRSVLRLKSMARALLDMMWTPVSRFYEFRPLKL